MSSVSPAGWQPPAEVSGVAPTTATSAPPVGYLQGTLDGVAGMLSLSTDDLRGALAQGSSISDLAAQKGVSRDSIVQAVSQQVQQQQAAGGKPPIDGQALDRVVNRAVDRHVHSQRHLPQAAPAATQQAAWQQQETEPQRSVDVLA